MTSYIRTIMLLFAASMLALSLVMPAGAAKPEARTPAAEQTGGPAPKGRQPEIAVTGPAPQPATVTVLNRTIVVFRGTLFGYTPQDRAAVVTDRVMQHIERAEFGPVMVRKDPMGAIVMNNGQIVFTLTQNDLDALSGQTMEKTVDEAVRTLNLVLQEAREVQSFPNLLKSVGYMAVATVLFAAAVWVIRRLHRWLLTRLTEKLLPRLEKLSMGGSVYLTDIATAVLRFIIGLAALLSGLFLADVWITYSLHLFPYTRPWGETLHAQVFIALAAFGRSVLSALPDLLVIVFIFLITRLLMKLVKRFFTAIESGQLKVTESFSETARPTYRIIVAVLWIFAVVAAYPYIPGSGTEAFKGMSLFVGLLVSLGSTSVVGQAASGLIMMYSRALRPGDYVRVGDTEGTVLSLKLLSTRIRTVKNEEVSIPNGVMVSSVTKNFSRLDREDGVILHTTVTIGYDTPWRQVHAMLLQAAERTAGLRKEPAPFVLQTALSDFYVEYQLNARLDRPEERIPVLAELHANIQDAFNEYGVQIMSPHYLGDPAKHKVVPKEQWYQAPARPGNDPGSKE